MSIHDDNESADGEDDDDMFEGTGTKRGGKGRGKPEAKRARHTVRQLGLLKKIGKDLYDMYILRVLLNGVLPVIDDTHPPYNDDNTYTVDPNALAQLLVKVEAEQVDEGAGIVKLLTKEAVEAYVRKKQHDAVPANAAALAEQKKVNKMTTDAATERKKAKEAKKALAAQERAAKELTWTTTAAEARACTVEAHGRCATRNSHHLPFGSQRSNAQKPVTMSLKWVE